MSQRDLPDAVWRKSSHSSGGTEGECVEVAALRSAEAVVRARDSKDPGGPVLSFSATEWESFLGAVKRDVFG
ncbi:DUF397 domain-containing protein [Actinomadura scrupuli]|uniref:DUF397 domain-containing protein n=1 Tax=Actinomadura scrupuli TaxID=559629 RepID=UPI003D96D300